MLKKLSRVLALAGSVAIIALSAAPAQGHPDQVWKGVGAFFLEVEFPDGTVHEALLICPGGKGHPHGVEACEQLEEANGDIASLSSDSRMCTMDYRPVTVRAHGLWKGRFHSYQGEFGNYCVAVGYTGGHVFDIAHD